MEVERGHDSGSEPRPPLALSHPSLLSARVAVQPFMTEVLFVSDSHEERELYTTGLPLQGFTVTAVDSLDTVAEVAGRLRPRVIVMCLRLGDDETWRMLEEIQCGEALGVPGILLSGSIRPDAQNRLHVMKSGCAAFVALPCTPRALASVIGAVLAGTRPLVILHPDASERSDAD